MSTTENANDTRYYTVLILGIIIGLLGVYLRFWADGVLISWISNSLLVVGVVIAFSRVFAIMK
jgi:hypothetical protein